MPNTKKTQEVNTLIAQLQEAPHFVVVKFEQTTHKALEQLRQELKKTSTKLRVVKNTLFEKTLTGLAGKDKNIEELTKKVFPLKENSALLTMSGDYAAALSAFFTFTKKDKSLSFKFGVLDKTIYLGPELDKIAKLPGREVLLAKLIGGMKSPSSKLVYSMKFNISKLTLVLKERSKQTN